MTFVSSSIDTREGLLAYFISMIVLYVFDIYFKIIITLFFLNRDYVSNVLIAENSDNDDSDED